MPAVGGHVRCPATMRAGRRQDDAGEGTSRQARYGIFAITTFLNQRSSISFSYRSDSLAV